MSGAEFVFALSVACNAMQIISFGREIYKAITGLQKSTSPHQHLSHYGPSIKSILDDIEDKATTTLQQRPLRPDEENVIKCAKQCADATDSLLSMLDSLAVSPEVTGIRKMASKLKQGFKSVLREKDLERAEKVLARQQSLLETQQLASICTRTDAAAMETTEYFKDLDNTLQHFIKQYAAGMNSLATLIVQSGQVTRGHVTATGHEVKKHIAESTNLIRSDLLHHQEATYAKKESEMLLSTFRFPEMNDRKSRVTGGLAATFRWVFPKEGNCIAPDVDESNKEDDEENANGDSASSCRECFWDWLQSDGKIFWIQGKPGSGKSTLMKFIVSRLQKGDILADRDKNAIIISHYFWKPGTELQHSVKGMLCSLLCQLLEADSTLASTVRVHEILASKQSHYDWSVSELNKMLNDLLQACSNLVFVFLDGLDEIVESSDFIPDSLEFLTEIKRAHGVRVCTSSRSEPQFLRYFKGEPCLTMQHINQKDIFQLVDSQLVATQDISRKQHICLLESITSRADGVFLWALLVVRSVNKGVQDRNSFHDLCNRLERLPRDLETLYEDMWQRLGDDTNLYQQAAAEFFTLVRFRQDCPTEWERSTWTVLELAAATDSTLLTYFDALADGSWVISARDVTAIDVACQRTRDRVETRCAGILELRDVGVSTGIRYIPRSVEASAVLRHASTGVIWVHRSAADFLVDTSTGKAIMATCVWNLQDKSERVTKARVLSDFLVMKDQSINRPWLAKHGTYEAYNHWIHGRYLDLWYAFHPSRRHFTREHEKREMVETSYRILDSMTESERSDSRACTRLCSDFGILYYQAMFERRDVVISRLRALSLANFLSTGHEALLGTSSLDMDDNGLRFNFTKAKEDIIQYIVLRVQNEARETSLSPSWIYALKQVYWSLICGGIALVGDSMLSRGTNTRDRTKALCDTVDIFHNFESPVQAAIDLHGNFRFTFTLSSERDPEELAVDDSFIGSQRRASSMKPLRQAFPDLGYTLNDDFSMWVDFFVLLDASYKWATTFIWSQAGLGGKRLCEEALSPKVLMAIGHVNSLFHPGSTSATYVSARHDDLSTVDSALKPLLTSKAGCESFNMDSLVSALEGLLSGHRPLFMQEGVWQAKVAHECDFHSITKTDVWKNLTCVGSLVKPKEQEKKEGEQFVPSHP